MKKVICLLSMIITIFSLNISYATTEGNVYLSSDKDILNISDEVEISVNIENEKTAAFTIYLYFDNDKFEYVSGPENSKVVENYIVNVWYDPQGGNNPKEGNIAKFKFRANQNGFATFNIQGEFYSSVGQEIKTSFKEKQIQIGDTNENIIQKQSELKSDEEQINYLSVNNTNLEVLAVQNVLLNPPFDANVTNYNIEVSNQTTSLNIFAASENENASIEIVGKDDLKQGENLIKVIVTAQDGVSKKVYEINAYKRNEQEEAEYLKGQEENKKKLEEIYKAQRTSNEQTDVPQKSKSTIIYVLIIIISVVLIAIIIYFIKRKQNKK